MKYRKQNGINDLFGYLEHQKRNLKLKISVAKLKDIIDWEDFWDDLEDILGYKDRHITKGGRPTFLSCFYI